MDNKQKVINLLKTTRGQIDGIIKMIENDKQCFDILTQVLAISGLIKKTNLMIIENHLNHCINDSNDNKNAEEKLDEIMILFKTYLKS